MNKEELISILAKRGFSDKIVKAFQDVKREEFIPAEYKSYAYEDRPLPIGGYSTISQPYTIAFMLELLELEGAEKVLEIGSGCGYVLALMDKITDRAEIYGLEIDESICEDSQKNLKDYKNITIFCMDGKEGLEENAPFDRILISAACPNNPYHLKDQLTNHGILVASVNNYIIQMKKVENTFEEEIFPGFSFVPLI